jgi:CRP-like cAMP-binding protein
MLPFARRHVGALLQLARHTVVLRAEPGQVLWREGDAADGALFLVRGSVDACVPAQEDPVLGPGCVLGGFDALAGVPRWFTALAREPLLALNLPVERFLDVLEDQHELARDLLRDLARGLLVARAIEPMPSLPGSSS